MKRLIIFLFYALSLYPGAVTIYAGDSPGTSGSISVEIKGLRSSSGEVRVNLYNSKDGFPSDPGKAFMKLTGKIEKNEANVVFNDVPFGEYAIAVLHDENGNKKMDFKWMMIPKEGIGASNNPKSYIGPPGFSDTKFKLTSELLTVKINMHY